jgi:cyanophycin synthetase
LQLGHGANQKRIRRSETTLTTALAKALSSEKELTCALLRSAGLPVPAGSVVANAEEAWSKAEELGLPVVVKPKDSCQSRGVFLGLRSRTEVLVAFEQARAEGSAVLVEKFVPGVEHRLLVVGNRVAAACRGDPAQVVGDGVHAIRNLIEVQINSDPRRGEHAAAPLDPLTVDSSMLLLLQQQGYTPESVPMTGAEVLVRRNGNLAVDVTERVHPAVAASVLKAVHLVGLDVAGVDVVAEDIGRPLEEQGGCILEVNGGPGLQMHLQPGQGTAQPVIEIILDSLFPDVELARVPIVALVGDVPNALGFRLAEALQTRFGHVAWSSSEGLFLNQSLLKAGDLRDPAGVDMALLHPQVEAAVLELSRRGLLEESLGFDRAEVVVWMGGGERSLVEAVLRTARNGWILGNADAPEVVVRLADEPGKCVLFSLSEKPIEVGSAAPNVVTVWREGDCGILQRAGERRAFPIVGGFLESLTLECLRNSP